MISWHKPGQKVVCKVDAAWARSFLDVLARRHDKIHPVMGVVYTITRVVTEGDYVGFVLEEIVTSKDIAWLSTGFDPVYPQIVEQLLHNPAPARELETNDA